MVLCPVQIIIMICSDLSSINTVTGCLVAADNMAR
jgi:hypothetical protein